MRLFDEFEECFKTGNTKPIIEFALNQIVSRSCLYQQIEGSPTEANEIDTNFVHRTSDYTILQLHALLAAQSYAQNFSLYSKTSSSIEFK